MTRGQLRLPTRVALAFYPIQHLNLDLKLLPERQQLVLVNKSEVDAACEAAKTAARAALDGDVASQMEWAEPDHGARESIICSIQL